jgi:hypothetical protein
LKVKKLFIIPELLDNQAEQQNKVSQGLSANQPPEVQLFISIPYFSSNTFYEKSSPYCWPCYALKSISQNTSYDTGLSLNDDNPFLNQHNAPARRLWS